jgi:hypothetical protein
MFKRVTLTSTAFIVACAVEALSLSGATQEIDTNRVYASSISVVLKVAHFRPTPSRSGTRPRTPGAG